jgi:hypothetical protein
MAGSRGYTLPRELSEFVDRYWANLEQAVWNRMIRIGCRLICSG